MKRLKIFTYMLLAALIFSSCANAMPEGPSGTGFGAAADTRTQTDKATDADSAALPPDETAGHGTETDDPSTDTGASVPGTSGDPEGTYYDPAELWDATARAAAIEKLKAALPVHNWETEKYSITVRHGVVPGYSEVSSSRYHTVTSDIKLIKEQPDGPKEVSGQFTATAAINAEDKELWIIFQCPVFRGGFPVLINFAENCSGFYFISKSKYFDYVEYGPENSPVSLADVFRSSDPTETVSRRSLEAIAEKLDSLLKSVDPSLSLADLGIYGVFPETDPRPGSHLIFDDSRYRATVETLTDGTGGTRLKIEDATGHFQYVSLAGNGRARVFAIAYKLVKGNIRVTVFQEYLRTDSEGNEKYSMAVLNIDLVDGILYKTVPESAQARQQEGVFPDVGMAVHRAAEKSKEILNIAKTEVTDCEILADYYSDRPESENRYMTPGELPEKADWKIGTELGLVWSE